MLSFFAKPCLGIEITSRAVRVCIPAKGNGIPASSGMQAETLASGTILEGYSAPNVRDEQVLASALSTCIAATSRPKLRRSGLSLADSVFRMQSLEFDDFPAGDRDREKLVRWKLDKAASFDTGGTLLRYQAVHRPGGGCSVMVCAAKQEVLSQYEDLLEGMGREVWNIRPSSLNALNFYAAELQAAGAAGYAFCWVTEGWYSLVVMESGGPRFYRMREIKPGAAGDASIRIVREIEDTLHFYAHRDRGTTAGISRLALAGDAPFLAGLAGELKQALALDVAVLGQAPAGAGGMAPALGAGGAV